MKVSSWKAPEFAWVRVFGDRRGQEINGDGFECREFLIEVRKQSVFKSLYQNVYVEKNVKMKNVELENYEFLNNELLNNELLNNELLNQEL